MNMTKTKTMRRTIATLLLAVAAGACEYRPAQPTASNTAPQPPVNVAVVAPTPTAGATGAGSGHGPGDGHDHGAALVGVPLGLPPGVPLTPAVIPSCAATIAVAGMS